MTRANLLSVLTAVLVLAAGFAVYAGLQANAKPDNAAIADPAATAEVADQVSAGVKAIFSYDYANLDRTERAAAGVLVDDAVGQYQAAFTAAKQQASDQKLVRTTNVGSTGVQDVRGDTARLLVFVDQQTLNTTTNAQSSAPACLLVKARKIDGQWKIASLTAL
ncbi:SnoaL-like domain-containing protein [Amycolatopsis sp. K13G38]|uniref:SnoaL-like domain-containing protein n=1 Tax=Amycolatopsis acididurans TaxID=2724524 RepID=A0ABX1IZP6_9PSEU|nr:nuclear transport factor 2 family protein [Amycolatopsis acididurans]NKQ52988.1 SnoaL-like domain-containing protein [Amycolatopsis acididurans]